MAFSSLAERLLHAHYQVELALALDHLRGGRAADGGLHQRVDVAHVQAVAGNLGAVRRNGQAGLAQFPHDRDFGDAANLLQDVLDLRRLSSSVTRSPPKIFTASELFSPVSASSTASSAGWV